MPYTLYVDEAGPWLAIDYRGVVESEELIASRTAAAELNPDGRLQDFILDFSAVTELVLEPDVMARVRTIDRERSTVVPTGRCALVAHRDVVQLATKFLGAVSVLDLDYRHFATRADAETWLRGERSGPPPVPRLKRFSKLPRNADS